MINLIDEFLSDEKRARLMKYTGAISAICGIFLTISSTNDPITQGYLATAQLFWLSLLMLLLTTLVFSTIGFAWKKENPLSKKYDFPHGIFSIFIGYVLVYVLLNLYNYVATVYIDILARFIVSIVIPAFILLGSISLDIFMVKREDHFPMIARMTTLSLSMGAIVGLGGITIQYLITNLFYPYWFMWVAPIIAVIIFFLSIGFNLYKRRNILKPYIH